MKSLKSLKKLSNKLYLDYIVELITKALRNLFQMLHQNLPLARRISGDLNLKTL